MIPKLTRRRLLGLIGSGAISPILSESAKAKNVESYNIGVRTDRAERKVVERAESVDRRIEFLDDKVAINGLFNESEAKLLEEIDGVRYVERDGQVKPAAQSLTWNIDRVDADRIFSNETGGDDNGAHLAIIDSGIDPDHPDLEANIGEGRNFTSDSTGEWQDECGHGTKVAGIAAAINNSIDVVGVAPGVTMHAVRVFDSGCGGSVSTVADGLRWAADQGYDVANMSLEYDIQHDVLEDAVEYADSKGMLLVAAAGNNNLEDSAGYPAQHPEVISVNATKQGDIYADFASVGGIDIAAPGDNIKTTQNGGGTVSGQWGTSLAAPHVAGAGAQLMDNGLNATEARNRMANTAEDIGQSSSTTGAGLLDVEVAVSGTAPPQISVDSTNPKEGDSVDIDILLDDLGDASSPDIYVEYREKGNNSWNSTTKQSENSTGTITRTVSGLTENTDYEFRVVGEGNLNSLRKTDTKTFRTGEDVPNVTTGSPSNVDKNSVDLSGTLDDLGQASSVNVYFEYRKKGEGNWMTSSKSTKSSTGQYSQSIAGLEDGTEYEFKAASTGKDGDSATGNVSTFTTQNTINVTTKGSSDIGTSSVKLEGSLDDLASAPSAKVYFEYRKVGNSSWISTEKKTIASPTSYSKEITGLDPGTDYEFRFVGETDG